MKGSQTEMRFEWKYFSLPCIHILRKHSIFALSSCMVAVCLLVDLRYKENNFLNQSRKEKF
jgi:hypothetical protein